MSMKCKYSDKCSQWECKWEHPRGFSLFGFRISEIKYEIPNWSPQKPNLKVLLTLLEKEIPFQRIILLKDREKPFLVGRFSEKYFKEISELDGIIIGKGTLTVFPITEWQPPHIAFEEFLGNKLDGWRVNGQIWEFGGIAPYSRDENGQVKVLMGLQIFERTKVDCWSFFGGKYELADGDIIGTAMREFNEECYGAVEPLMETFTKRCRSALDRLREGKRFNDDGTLISMLPESRAMCFLIEVPHSYFNVKDLCRFRDERGTLSDKELKKGGKFYLEIKDYCWFSWKECKKLKNVIPNSAKHAQQSSDLLRKLFGDQF